MNANETRLPRIEPVVADDLSALIDRTRVIYVRFF